MLVAYLAVTYLTTNMYTSLIVKFVVAMALVIIMGEFGGLSDYNEIKNLLKEQLSKTKFRAWFRFSNKKMENKT